MDKPVLCIRRRVSSDGHRAPKPTLSFHEDLVVATAGKDAAELRQCEFFDVTPWSKQDIYLAACQALNEERQRTIHRSHKAELELREEARLRGVDLRDGL